MTHICIPIGGVLMSNQYQTVKLPKGLIEKVREVVSSDASFLNVSDYVRYAVRKLLNDLKFTNKLTKKKEGV